MFFLFCVWPVEASQLLLSSRVRRSFVSVQHSSIGCGVAKRLRRSSVLRCGVAQLVVRRLAERQDRVHFSDRHPKEVFSQNSQAMGRWRDLFKWRRMNVLKECDGMNLCAKNIKKKQKYWDWFIKGKHQECVSILIFVPMPLNDSGLCELYLQIYFYNW